MKKLHELEQERNNIAVEMRSLNDRIGDVAWTDEQRSQFKDMQKSLRDLDDKISMEKELRNLDDEHSQENRDSNNNEQEDRSSDDSDKKYASAFDAFARRGLGELTSDEKRALGTAPQAAGGFTVPVSFQSRLIETMKSFGGIANHANLLVTTDGRTMQWATSDGTSEMGEFIAENTAAGEDDPSFGSAELGAKKMTSKVIRISNELLQDTGIAMESFLINRIGMRIGRGEANGIVNGTGTGTQIKGLAEQVTGTTPAKAADINWKDINSLIHSVDPAYRAMNSFALCFNDNTLQVLEEQEDGQGRPLWLPAVAGGSPATILGRPYFIDQAVADIGADNKFMYAGDWKALLLRRVQYMQLKRLTEKYAEFDQTGFLAFHRFDLLLEDVAAIKALTGAAA